jgi:hypothetical protein
VGQPSRSVANLALPPLEYSDDRFDKSRFRRSRTGLMLASRLPPHFLTRAVPEVPLALSPLPSDSAP